MSNKSGIILEEEKTDDIVMIPDTCNKLFLDFFNCIDKKQECDSISKEILKECKIEISYYSIN